MGGGVSPSSSDESLLSEASTWMRRRCLAGRLPPLSPFLDRFPRPEEPFPPLPLLVVVFFLAPNRTVSTVSSSGSAFTAGGSDFSDTAAGAAVEAGAASPLDADGFAPFFRKLSIIPPPAGFLGGLFVGFCGKNTMINYSRKKTAWFQSAFTWMWLKPKSQFLFICLSETHLLCGSLGEHGDNVGLPFACS